MNNEIINTLNVIYNKYGVSANQLKSKSRKGNIAKARINAYVILRCDYGITYGKIGSYFGRGTSNIIQLVKIHKDKFDDLKVESKEQLTISEEVLYEKLLIVEIELKHKLSAIQNLMNFYK